MGILNITDKTTIDLDINGLPEKCVWNKTGTAFYCAIPEFMSGSPYPDIWYQGVASFNDRFVKGDPFSGALTYFVDSSTNTPVDATNLSLDTTEKNLFFTNKKDSTLWALSLQ
jgi:hypothetical protein